MPWGGGLTSLLPPAFDLPLYASSPTNVGVLVSIPLNQATEFGYRADPDALVRLLCHVALDKLPPRANEELFRTLCSLYEHYWTPPERDPAPRVTVRRLTRPAVRVPAPEVAIDES